MSGPALTELILEDARTAQAEFATRYTEAAKRNDQFNIPLLAAAAATAALLFAKPNSDAIFAVGLGAGTYAASRAILAPPALAPLYRQAHEALGCVRRQGPAFSGADAIAAEAAFRTRVESLQEALTRAELASVVTPPPKAPAAELAEHQATQLRLRDLIAASRAVEQAAQRELAAFGGAPQLFGGAVEAIHNAVATKGRDTRPLDYAAVTQSLLTAGKAAIPVEPSGPPMPGAASAGGVKAVSEPNAAFVQLATARAAVENNLPEWSTALDRVSQCPALVRGP